jgi:hypothetical protein
MENIIKEFEEFTSKEGTFSNIMEIMEAYRNYMSV